MLIGIKGSVQRECRRVCVALGNWYGGVVMGVLLSFDEATILYRDFKVRRHKSIIL